MKNIGHRSIKVVAFLLSVALLFGFVSGGAYAAYSTQLLSALPDDSGNVIKPTSQINVGEGLIDQNDETVNFLVVGTDEEGAMTDVILVINLNEVSGEINVLQIPRDTYVGDDVVYTGKINAVYSNAKEGKTGIENLINQINESFYLSIDHYIRVSLSAFKSIVDIMGGIEVNLPQTIQLEGGEYLYKGKQVLTGRLAEVFVRHRKGYVTGDIGRMDAQVVFLKALIEKLFTVSASEAVSIATECVSLLRTDLTVKQMIEYYSSVKSIGKAGIEFHRIPGEPITPAYNGHSIFAVDTKETAKILNTYFRPNSADIAGELFPMIDSNFLIEEGYAYGGANASGVGSGNTGEDDDDEDDGDEESYDYVEEESSASGDGSESSSSSSTSGYESNNPEKSGSFGYQDTGEEEE